MAQVLQLPQLAQPHDVAEVNVRSAGVESHFEAERATPVAAWRRRRPQR